MANKTEGARHFERTEHHEEIDLEKTDKKTGDVEDSEKPKQLCAINKTYLVPKFFYFFFLSGQGSLLPYLSLFFKELELPASRVGIISGIKPYIAFICIPLWGAFADRYKKSKLIFVISLLAIAGGFVAVALVPVNLCDERHLIKKPSRDVYNFTAKTNLSHWKSGYLERVAQMAEQSLEETPWPLPDSVAFEGENVNRENRIERVFLYLLLVTIFSTIFSCPGLTIADHATVQVLKDHGETHKYGKQRLWGSIGYGMTAFLVGAAVSKTHLCPPGNSKRKDVNYYPCFYVHTLCILAALAIGVRFKFDNDKQTAGSRKRRDPCSDFKSMNEDDKEEPLTENNDSRDRSPEMGDRRKDAGVVAGLKELARTKHIMFFATAFYVGITMGLIKVFLFWHLKDLGGTQLLFSFMSAINSTAEVLVYFLSSKLIASIGHIRVLYLGLVCYSLRLFYYAFVRNPWYVLPIEPLSGITTAGVWAAMMTYVGHNSVEGATVTLQGKPCPLTEGGTRSTIILGIKIKKEKIIIRGY